MKNKSNSLDNLNYNGRSRFTPQHQDQNILAKGYQPIHPRHQLLRQIGRLSPLMLPCRSQTQYLDFLLISPPLHSDLHHLRTFTFGFPLHRNLPALPSTSGHR